MLHTFVYSFSATDCCSRLRYQASQLRRNTFTRISTHVYQTNKRPIKTIFNWNCLASKWRVKVNDNSPARDL
ncbi:hypothetical protein GHT06_009535 [Daphnia sinensis]|uniref:Uncharacterized protein n=1 Tax=Daphnia sinensis TaxID=1820382 RepID=A0AAD5LX49_9CRUS|nr:hypothetical protein GHT06_009535 [Daphnia sinensis]